MARYKKKKRHVLSGTKTTINGIEFDSKMEAEAYKILHKAFGVNLMVQPTFVIMPPANVKSVDKKVYLTWGKKLVQRKVQRLGDEKMFTPDFLVTYKKRKYLIEIKNPYVQSRDYPLRRAMFLRSHQFKYYEYFFEVKKVSLINDVIKTIIQDGKNKNKH